MTKKEYDFGMVSTHYAVSATDGLMGALDTAFKKNKGEFLRFLDDLSDFMARRMIDGYLDMGEKAKEIDGEHLVITIGFKHVDTPERKDELFEKFAELNKDTPEGEKEKTFFDIA